MALDTYANLKTSISDWMARSDLAGNVAEWITLAEARLNRELPAVEEEATLTATSSSRTIDVSAYSIVEPLALYLVDPDTSDERRLVKRDTIAYENENGEPRYWTYDSDDAEINFDRPADQAYSLRFQFRERFTLSDSATTNWLLTNHPDVYLAASIFYGGMFEDNDTRAGKWKALLESEIPSVRNIIAQQKRSVAEVDKGIRDVGMRPYYDWTYDT